VPRERQECWQRAELESREEQQTQTRRPELGQLASLWAGGYVSDGASNVSGGGLGKARAYLVHHADYEALLLNVIRGDSLLILQNLA
jgi:hypothetical protein